jgi:16S rRNA (cytidine1402-2'-O)-methyltransferase
LEYLKEYCSGDRKIAIVREATKLHEEILRGTVDELLAVAKARGSWKGEFVIGVAPERFNENAEEEYD